MSLFPAYASTNGDEDQSNPSTSVSLSWLHNESCPPEVGQILLPPPVTRSLPEDSVITDKPDDILGTSSKSKKKKKKKDKKRKKKHKDDSTRKGKKKQKGEGDSESDSTLSSRSCSESGSPYSIKYRSRSSSNSERSASLPKKKKLYSKSCRRHSKSRSRSQSESRSKKRHSRSRSQSRKRKSRSRSGSRKLDSRSRSRSRKLRSRSMSRSRVRKQMSRSRSRSRKRTSRSRSRYRKITRPRSRSRERPLGFRSTSGKKSRPRSRSRKRKSRSISRSRAGRSRSRSRTRKQKYRSGSRNESPKESRPMTETLLRKGKSVFLTDLIGLVNPEDAFYVETSGDKNNLIFPMTHFSQLAKYSVKSKGILGHPYGKSNVGLRKILRYFKKAARKILFSNAELLRPLPQKSQSSMPSDDSANCYIPLELTYAELKELKGKVSSINQSKQNTEEFLLEVDSEDEEKGEKSEEAECAFWQKKTKEYNERLSQEPANVGLWLEFVRFQDKSFEYLYKNEENGKKKKVSLKAMAERKISILDSAIKKNIRSLDLQFERLVIGQDIWDDKKLKQEWGTVIINFPNKLEVWHRYLAFMQTNFTSFSLTSVVSTFSKCTEKLQQMKNGVFITHAPPKDLGKCLVDITFQLAFVWKQAGYLEKSVALFQALVELNLFAPPHAQSKNIAIEAKLALFEAFWDSRAPRFGEEKAIGWAQVMEKREQVEFPEIILGGTQDEEDEIIAKGGETSDLWLTLESRRERCHWLPWEQDPEDCEDPERMVSFEDLSCHLYILDSKEDCFYLILKFLIFLGVPCAHKLISQRADIRNKCCKGVSSDIFRPLVVENLLDDKLFGRTKKLREFIYDGRGILNFPEIGPTISGDSCSDYYRFICGVLQQASGVIQLPYKVDLTILYMKVLGLQFETLKLDPKANLKSVSKELKKKVKQLLKSEEFRTCLPMYREYAKLEEIMGHDEDSENVLTTALAVGTAAGKSLDIYNVDFKNIMELYKSYLELEMKREGESGKGIYSNNIINSLTSIVLEGRFSTNSISPVPGPVILKTKKLLQEIQASILVSAVDDSTDREKNRKMLLYAKLTSFLALVQLFTVGFKSAYATYETTIKKIENCSDELVSHKLEDITLPGEGLEKSVVPRKSSAKDKSGLLEYIIEEFLWFAELSSLLHPVMGGERVSPLQLRSILSLAVNISPDNPEFLLHFALSQTWRDLLSCSEIVSQTHSILMTVCRLLPHIQRTISLVTNTDEGILSSGHRLERVLEQGVSSLPGRHCPLLWRMYLALIAATRPAGIKELVYRALSSCPGVKSVYLDCVRWVPEMLQEIVKLLGEKGIRVRLPLEELQVLTETELDLEDEMDTNQDTRSDVEVDPDI